MSHLTLILHTGTVTVTKSKAEKYLAAGPDFNSDNIAKWLLCSIIKSTGKLPKNARKQVVDLIKNGSKEPVDCRI